jgi:hypothetical protein
MSGNARWMAAAIVMDSGCKIAMDSGGSDGQRQCNGWQDGGVIMMGNGATVAQWMAQWAADNCCQRRGGAMGGNARWTAAAIRIDGGCVTVMDGGSGDGQLWCNGQQDSKAIAMGGGVEALQWKVHGWQTIAANAEVAQWEDGQQW